MVISDIDYGRLFEASERGEDPIANYGTVRTHGDYPCIAMSANTAEDGGCFCWCHGAPAAPGPYTILVHCPCWIGGQSYVAYDGWRAGHGCNCRQAYTAPTRAEALQKAREGGIPMVRFSDRGDGWEEWNREPVTPRNLWDMAHYERETGPYRKGPYD